MCDVEVSSDITRHPGVVYPEELDMLGGLSDVGCSLRCEDVDPALAVVGVHVGLEQVGRHLVVGDNPLALLSLY